MKKIISFLAAVLFLLNTFAQNIFPPDTVKKKIKILQIEGNIKIDGLLNEPEWQIAVPIPGFIQMDPLQGMPAEEKTCVRLLCNKLYLYVSAICYDTVGKNKFRVPNFKRDFSIASGDDFSIAIDGYNDERNAVSFATNPYGVQSDLLSFDDNYYDTDWDGLWVVRAQRTDTSWNTEIAIPWKTLRYKRSNDSLQTWGISFGRTARTVNELSAWPAFPRAYTTFRMPYAAKLVNIHAPNPSTNLRVQPYSLYSYNETKENSKTISTKNSFKPGGDIKWAINTNTLLDVTINTDFAQSDADRQVNNINRFSVFFPERRQFFLENAGLFAVGIDPLPGNGLADYSARIQPFSSRAIGLDTNGGPLNITGGARLISRSDKRNIGALLVRQDGNDNTNPAWFIAGRYSKNFGKQNRIGALISYKSEEAKLNGTADKNFTGTIDGFSRFNQLLSLSYMGSLTTSKQNTPAGYAGAAQLIYNSNGLYAWWNQSVNSENYNPEMGFVARKNVIITEPGLYYQIRGACLPNFIRAVYPGISYITYHNTKTLKLTDRYFNFIPAWIRFQNRSLIFYNVTFTLQNVESNFNLLGENVTNGVYKYTRQKFGFASDQSKKIAITVTANTGDFYNGKYNSVSAILSLSPIPNIYVSPNIETGRLSHFGSNEVAKNVTLYSLESRLALNPRVQLSGLFQKYSISNSINWNVRFSWEVAPLSYFYFVFNHNSNAQIVKTTQEQAIAKITYLRQF